MKLAVEDKSSKIAFYRIDGRQLEQFIKKAEKDINNIHRIWAYDYVDKDGFFQNGKDIKKY
jgi:hypothetical protein